jgi:hypothetical protein
VVIEEGTANGVGNETADVPLIAEADFAFGRVDVDIDAGGVQFEEEAADRVATPHQARVVAFVEGEVQAAAFDRTAVDEEVLVLPGSAGDPRRADEAPEPERAGTVCRR